MTIHKGADLISLGLTIPFLILAAWLLKLWFGGTKSGYAAERNQRSSHQWITIGVFLGFAGGWFDNTFWGVAWSNHFLDSPYTEWWFGMGVYANIPFRQTLGIMAAYCHIRAYFVAAGVAIQHLNRVTLASFACGALYAVALVWVKT